MSRNFQGNEPLTLDEKLLPKLDERPGPAPRLPPEWNDQLVRSILDRALSPPTTAPIPIYRTKNNRSRRIMLLAASLTTFLSLGAIAITIQQSFFSAEQESKLFFPNGSPKATLSTTSNLPRKTVPPDRNYENMKETPPKSPRIHSPAAVSKDMLARANEFRRARHWKQADKLYQAVVNRFPRSDAAIVAQIASAALHLQHLHDPDGALKYYRQALAARPTGPLAEEARWGIAETQRALGDTRAEAAALGDFLAHHPQSAMAPLAKHRSAEVQP